MNTHNPPQSPGLLTPASGEGHWDSVFFNRWDGGCSEPVSTFSFPAAEHLSAAPARKSPVLSAKSLLIFPRDTHTFPHTLFSWMTQHPLQRFQDRKIYSPLLGLTWLGCSSIWVHRVSLACNPAESPNASLLRHNPAPDAALCYHCGHVGCRGHLQQLRSQNKLICSQDADWTESEWKPWRKNPNSRKHLGAIPLHRFDLQINSREFSKAARRTDEMSAAGDQKKKSLILSSKTKETFVPVVKSLYNVYI